LPTASLPVLPPVRTPSGGEVAGDIDPLDML